MTELTFRDAVPADIATIIALSHAGDARGKDAPPLDPAALDDPRYRAAFDEIAADPNHRLVVAEKAGELVGTIQISFIPGLPRFGDHDRSTKPASPSLRYRPTHLRAQRTLTPAASAAAVSVHPCTTTRSANNRRPHQLSAALR